MQVDPQSRHENENSGGRPFREFPKIYSHLDTATEFLIYAILLFTPWAFGTTERWAIASVNVWNYLLGGLLASKWIVRRVTGFQPDRWEVKTDGQGGWVVVTMALGTILLIVYCALSAFNARADFIYAEQRFEYFEKFVAWLPHSYDQSESWRSLQMYLGAACFFWSVRDWILTKSPRECRFGQTEPRDNRFPERLKKLLWVLCANGAILAVEGMIQRFSGTRDLLWSVRPQYNAYAGGQFGPFNYRANGAQYLNMLWPLALGFWWALHRRAVRKFGEGSEVLLLPLTAVMLAGAIVANSRGGIIIALGQAVALITLFAYAVREGAWWRPVFVVAVFSIVLASTFAMQSQAIRSRFVNDENPFSTMSGRSTIYENSRPIAEEFVLWGTGPGTFPAVYQLYRSHPDEIWSAAAHDDFLETRITFGVFGLSVIAVMLTLVFCYSLLPRGASTPPLFAYSLIIAAAGCLAHARFDFPLQIYSLLLLFLTLSAVLMAISRK